MKAHVLIFSFVSTCMQKRKQTASGNVLPFGGRKYLDFYFISSHFSFNRVVLANLSGWRKKLCMLFSNVIIFDFSASNLHPH